MVLQISPFILRLFTAQPGWTRGQRLCLLINQVDIKKVTRAVRSSLLYKGFYLGDVLTGRVVSVVSPGMLYDKHCHLHNTINYNKSWLFIELSIIPHLCDEYRLGQLYLGYTIS